MIEPSCKTCRWWEPFNAVCFNGVSPDCADFTDRNHNCDYWGQRKCRCSGCLEAREFDGKILFHCYSCHAEFPYEVKNPDIVPSQDRAPRKHRETKTFCDSCVNLGYCKTHGGVVECTARGDRQKHYIEVLGVSCPMLRNRQTDQGTEESG